MYTVERKYPAESSACTVTRCEPALMLKLVEMVLVEVFSYFFTPSTYTCITLTAEEPGFAVAKIFTGEETVEPLVGEQMWMVRAVEGAEQVAVVLPKPNFMTKPSVGPCSVFCRALLVTGKLLDSV